MRINVNISLLAGIILLVFGFSSPVLGQIETPATDNIAAQVEMIKELNKIQLAFEKPISIEDKTEKQNEAISSSSKETLLIKKVILEGNQLLSNDDLSEITNQIEGQSVTFTQIKTTTNQITALYRSRGFLTSRAYLPPQKVKSGVIRIQILEGKTGNIKIENNRWFNERIYKEYFKDIHPDKPFEYQDLEKGLYFLNQKEDRQAKAFLTPGTEPGRTDITLKAEEKFPWHAGYEFNTRGSKLTHRARHMTTLRSSNFSGHDDTFESGMSLAEQAALRAGWASYSLPIHSTGTELGLSWNGAHSRLAKHLREFEIESDYLEITPTITQSILKHRTLKLDWFAGFEIKDSKSMIEDIKTSFDRMRVITIGPRFSKQDRWGKILASAEAHIGIGGFMGSLKKDDPNASRNGAGGSFVYYSGSFARLQRLPLNSILILQSAGQWSPVTLTSLEQFRAGGMTSVRGYPESDSAGDRGFTTSAEFNFPVPFVPQNWVIHFMNKKINEVVRLVAFYDIGATENRSRQRPTDEKNRFLMGAGFGTRINLGNYFNLNLDFGYPIGDESTDKDRPQIHLSVKAGF